MKKTALAILVMSMFAASSAMADGNKQEISLSGYTDNSTMSPGLTSMTQTVIQASYGYYFSPVLLGRLVGQEFLSSYNGQDSSTTAFGGGLKYYFGESKKSSWVPFAVGDILAVSSQQGGGSSSTGSGYDAGVGGSYFLTETVSFDVTGLLYSESISGSGGTTITIDGNRIEFGFTARF